MNAYLVKFTVTKIGFFCDTKMDGSEVIEAENITEAWKKSTEKANNLTSVRGNPINVTSITKFKGLMHIILKKIL